MLRVPEKFTINSQEIKIKVCDSLPNSNYGTYNDVKELIQIARTIKVDNEIVKLTNEQIWNTLIHEVLHAFQFHSKGETSEIESNTYAGYIVEFLKSTGLIEKL